MKLQHIELSTKLDLLSIIFLAEFVLYIFLGPETLYVRTPRNRQLQTGQTAANSVGPDGSQATVNAAPYAVSSDTNASRWYAPYITFRRHDRTSWNRLPAEVIAPLQMFLVPSVFLAASTYAVCFSYTNVLLVVETPALLGSKYMLNPAILGLQNVAVGYGTESNRRQLSCPLII